jgi:hypothetical protein
MPGMQVLVVVAAAVVEDSVVQALAMQRASVAASC